MPMNDYKLIEATILLTGHKKNNNNNNLWLFSLYRKLDNTEITEIPAYMFSNNKKLLSL